MNTDFYCTLFNANYGARGLALYRSLESTSQPFHLYILCMDEAIEISLKKLKMPHATLIRLKDFESSELLKVKSERSFAEYCWTCTPAIIKFCLEKYQLPQVTYVDADLGFFSNSRQLLQEFESSGASILLTEHRYTPEHDQSATSGTYCVQYMTFKSDARGMKALNWWNERCLEWCFNRFEDGKFGDQKYLDDWTSRFEGVHVLGHLGGGVAPWNVQQYHVSQDSGGRVHINGQPLVFYHFHNLKVLSETQVDLCRTFYALPKPVRQYIYAPYSRLVTSCLKELKEASPRKYDEFSESGKGRILRLLRKLRGRYYVVEI